MENQQPISEGERLPWIDAARGFALLGILMVNIPAFNAPYFLYGGEEVFWTGKANRAVQIIVDIFFQASFYTLFSLLFGFGMQMMKERLEAKGMKWQSILFRRLMILILFGIFHAFLLWHGDILLSYGIIGMLLFFFYQRSMNVLFGWIVGLLVIPSVLLTLLLYQVKENLSGFNDAGIEAAKEHYRSNIMEVWYQNYQDWVYANSGMGYLFLTIALLPMFLFGAAFMRNRWLHDVEKHRLFLKRVWGISLAGFILFKAGPYLLKDHAWLDYSQDHLGGAASSIFYLLTITMLYQNEYNKKWLKPFTYIGRLSLTNYIMQSVISFFLFYGPGLGLYGTVSPLESVGVVIGIYFFQVLFSKWWLTRFYFGPLEWVWRSLTYNKVQSFKRKQVVSYE
ncbi:MAG: DUF418 domain-containing protein [Bacillaceae bacterium]|nr:DUF418 domain-containing protein [Bacillaceae bacterium]